MRVLGLVFAGTSTDKRAEMARFLRDTLELASAQDPGVEADLFELPDGSRLAVADIGGMGETTRSIGFLVASLDEAIASLRAAGVEVGEPAENERHRYVHFRAPDGELYELVEERRRGPVPALVASHFRLLVASFPETFRFYREVIGLPTTYPPGAAGPYAEFDLGGDKYLGLFDRMLMLEAVGRPADEERSSDDHALLCISVEDVDEEARRLQGLGVELVAPPLDHEPWGMRTVYVRDPEGNLVELYGPLRDGPG